MSLSVAHSLDPALYDEAEIDRAEVERLDALYERELTAYARQLWDTQYSGTSVLKKLAKLAELADAIERRGPGEGMERELKLDACLTQWGAAHTMKMLCLAAEGKLS
jgi:tagatose-1,6-bisphosphate aldolase